MAGGRGKHWNGGGRSPVWFVADPLRSDLALVGAGVSRADAPEDSARWTLEYPVLLGGTRPSEMDWYAIPSPDWYLGEGWALTPETAGVAMEDRRGPGYAPIDGWIRRSNVSTATLMVGGRNLATGGTPARVRIAVDGRVADEADVTPGFFLRTIDVPPTVRTSGDGRLRARLTISAEPVRLKPDAPMWTASVRAWRPLQPDLSIEQFDAQPAEHADPSPSRYEVTAGTSAWEYNPATGKLWRWTSDRGVLRLRTPSQGLVLNLEGEVEAARASRVTIQGIGDRIVAAYDIGAVNFAIRQTIPQGNLVKEGDNTITISTDQTYVPAERRSSPDRRLLGLKIYVCRVTPAF